MRGPRSRRPRAPGGRVCMPDAPSPRPMRCPCHCRSGCTAVGGQPLMRPGTDGWGSVPRPNGSTLRLLAGGKGTHGGKAVDRSPRVPVADELLHLLRRGLHPGSALWLSPESGPGAGEWVGMYLARLPASVIRRGRSLLVSHCGCYRADRPGTVTSGAGRSSGGRGFDARGPVPHAPALTCGVAGSVG
jgi:hypothetical protein